MDVSLKGMLRFNFRKFIPAKLSKFVWIITESKKSASNSLEFRWIVSQWMV